MTKRRLGAVLAAGLVAGILLFGADGGSLSRETSAPLLTPLDATTQRDETPERVSTFLTRALGSPRTSGLALKGVGRLDISIEPEGGYTFTRGDASVSLAAEGTGPEDWDWYSNGATRRTPFGAETIIVTPRLTEQFLTVERREGLKTWRWNLRAPGLTPRLAEDGTLEFMTVDGSSSLVLLPVRILDGDGTDVGPARLRWSLDREGSRWWLELRLDDSKLPLPYVIDPAIVFKASSTSGNMGTTASLAIPKPVGAVAGDFLLAQVTVRDNPTITPPAGWTFVHADTKNPNLKQAIYWRVAGPELGPYTWTFSSTQFASGGIIAYTGVDASNPIDDSSGNTGNSTTLTALAVTTSVSDAMVVGFFGIARSTTLTPGAGLTFRYTVDSGGMGGATAHTMSMAADFTQATPGSTGNKTATAGQAADWVAQLVALRPAIRTTSTTVTCPASTPANSPASCTVTVTDTDSGTKSPPQGTVDLEFTAQPAGATATVVPDPCPLTTASASTSTCTFAFTGDTTGSYTIKGTYVPAQASVHAGSSGTDTISVTARSTSTSVDCPASTPVNTPAACTVTVTDTDTAPKSPPLGDVDFTFTDQPAGSIAVVAPDPCTLAPDPSPATDDSSCTITFTANTLGSYTIKGTYQPAAASVHATSDDSDTILVTARTTSTTVDCPASTPANTPVSCTVTVKDTDSAPKSPPQGAVDLEFTAQPTGSAPTLAPDPCPLTSASTSSSTCTFTFNSTKAGNYTIKGTYVPAPASVHASSFDSDTITVTAGPPAIVTVAPPTAANQVNTEHCVTATVTDEFGNPKDGVKVFFTVTGVNSAIGTRTTGADGTTANFCYTGRLFGEDTITAVADKNGNNQPDLGEPTGVATKTWTLPPSTPLCNVDFATYGVRIIALNGDRASAAGNARVDGDGNPTGQHEYQDQGPAQAMNVHSINVLAVVCTVIPGVGGTAQIYGEATIDGGGSYVYRIDVEDHGEPGTSDKYWIVLSNGYTSGDQTLVGGNVQIH
jgi:hypothetical protein